MTRGETKDLILKSIIRKENPLRNSNQIKDKLFPDKSIEEIQLLLREIDESSLESPVLNFERYTTYVINNGLTSETLRTGGFTKIEEDLINSEKKEELKEKLEIDLKKLQKKNLLYQEQIRVKENQIKELRIANLRLNNWSIRFRWLIAIGTFISGLIIKYFIDK